MENLDLTKILKVGDHVYSLVNGEGVVKEIIKDCVYGIKIDFENAQDVPYTKDGRYFNNEGETVLFPSKEERNWSKYISKKCRNKLEPFDKPNWCHHKVDLSNCSEEYRKAYYDGWNNCNQQHSQCESEKSDVLKCLINGMKFHYEDNEEATWGTEKFSMKVKDILSWLEMQGEQKPADKVEPKFNVGVWVVFNNKHQSIYQVEKIEDGYYILRHTHGGTLGVCVLHDENLRLWSIQDAKDGDVLVDKYNNIGIFQECEGICWHSYIYLGCDGELRGFSIGGSHEQTDTHPATKEQRDTLEKAMTNAGYKWDKGKLKKKPNDQ